MSQAAETDEAMRTSPALPFAFTPFGDGEVPEQHASGLGLQRLRMDYQEVIAEGALLLVTDLVSFQHLRSALRARRNRRHGRRVACSGRAGEPG